MSKKPPDLTKFLNDKKRLIAHAAGQINGDIYTNSLEALDLSYKKGFRLFELDLRLTKDNRLVAVHAWAEWKNRVDFKGELPPTYKEFMSYKIKNKYTPMDTEKLRVWFEKHPDTILVTDKINDPELIMKLFPFFKSRVFMELFSWEAVKKANFLGLRSIIIYGDLLFNDGDYISKLEKYKINYISLSQKKLTYYRDQVKNINENGYKIYLYGFNKYNVNNSKFNEENTLCSTASSIYGIYADDYIDINSITCK